MRRLTVAMKPAGVQWQLQRLMADRGIRYSAELRRRLEPVLGDATPSDAQLSRMVRSRPERLTLRTLEGLCEVLACDPGDLLTRTTSRRTTMKLYDSPAALAKAIDLPYDPGTGGSVPGFESEADWGWRASGLGSGPDTPNGGRWLVTFACGAPDAPTGHLIAYEIDNSNTRTGRCTLIRSPWSAETDRLELDRAIRERWWEPGGGVGTLHDLDTRLVR